MFIEDIGLPDRNKGDQPDGNEGGIEIGQGVARKHRRCQSNWPHFVMRRVFVHEAILQWYYLCDSFQEFLYGCNEDFGLLFVWKVPAIGYNHQLSEGKFTGKPDALLCFDGEIMFTGNDE